MDTSSISSILSQVTRIANINSGYTVTTTTHEESAGKITSVSSTYTLYDRSASIEDDHTPRYGAHIDTTV